jgi:hypothetical protein
LYMVSAQISALIRGVQRAAASAAMEAVRPGNIG